VKQVVALQPEHVCQIIERNSAEGKVKPAGISIEEMMQAYFSAGSVSYCLLIDGVPAAAAGIINLGWRRGEAWLLHSSLFDKHIKTSFKLLRDMLPNLAQINKFRRIQATCFSDSDTLFVHLGFEREGILKSFGPNGENATVFSRLFS
jgi:hypothetical protein